jgi:arginyl-tRNA synthetase
LVSTSLDSHLEIDVDKVKKHDNNNPIYYVQYAHARINQIILKSKNIRMSNKYDLLNSEAENEIKLHILSLKPLLLQISKSYSVHLLCAYLTQLAKMFHSYYANNKIIDEKNRKVSSQRLAFAKLIQNVLAIGMRLLGITPSEKME